jgi:hypothetical protein
MRRGNTTETNVRGVHHNTVRSAQSRRRPSGLRGAPRAGPSMCPSRQSTHIARADVRTRKPSIATLPAENTAETNTAGYRQTCILQTRTAHFRPWGPTTALGAPSARLETSKPYKSVMWSLRRAPRRRRLNSEPARGTLQDAATVTKPTSTREHNVTLFSKHQV